MKVAIITLPLHTNYGGILQAYALQTTIQNMGHEVDILEEYTKPIHNPVLLPLVYIKRFICKYLLGQDVEVFKGPEERIRKYTNSFIKKYINIVKIKNWSKQLASEYDVFIVGSDQVWRPKYCPFIEHAFLDFTTNTNVIRLSYAASFGTDVKEYSPDLILRCRELIKQFKAVSVREDSGVKLIKDYFGIESEHVLDPTMLLTKEDYVKLFQNAKVSQSPGNMLVYILDESNVTDNIVEKIAKEEGLIPFKVNSKVENPLYSIRERIQPPVEKWLRGFSDAELVITDSFHACVFALIFNKKIRIINNEKRGFSRINSLMKAKDLPLPGVPITVVALKGLTKLIQPFFVFLPKR